MSDSEYEPIGQGDGDSNEVFELDGVKLGTGCAVPSEEVMSLVKSTYAMFPQNRIYTPDQIKKRLEGDRYLKLREKRRKRMINQGQIGKCNPSALKGAVHQIRESQGMPFIEMSDSWAYLQINGGRDNGSLLEDAARLSAKGMAPKLLQVGGRTVEFPESVYNKSQVNRDVMAAANEAAKDHTTHELFIAPDNWEDFVMVISTAIACDFPVIHAWHVGNNGMRLNNGYVNNSRGPGNHANFFHSGKWVGGKTLVHPDNQNSWGINWGDGGFGLFTMESAFQCRKYHTFYVLTSCNVDPGSELH
jgi:hypothetical protein